MAVIAADTSPAATVAARLESDVMQVGRAGVVVPVFAAISVSSGGDNTIVTNTTTNAIRVLEYSIVCNAAIVVTWKSSVAGAISGPLSFSANGGISAAFSPIGHFQTAAGENLVLNLAAGISVGGHLAYILV